MTSVMILWRNHLIRNPKIYNFLFPSLWCVAVVRYSWLYFRCVLKYTKLYSSFSRRHLTQLSKFKSAWCDWSWNCLWKTDSSPIYRGFHSDFADMIKIETKNDNKLFLHMLIICFHCDDKQNSLFSSTTALNYFPTSSKRIVIQRTFETKK